MKILIFAFFVIFAAAISCQEVPDDMQPEFLENAANELPDLPELLKHPGKTLIDKPPYRLVFKGLAKDEFGAIQQDKVLLWVTSSLGRQNYIDLDIKHQYKFEAYLKIVGSAQIGFVKISKTIVEEKYVVKIPIELFNTKTFNHYNEKRFIVGGYEFQWLVFSVYEYNTNIGDIWVPYYQKSFTEQLDEHPLKEGDSLVTDIFFIKNDPIVPRRYRATIMRIKEQKIDGLKAKIFTSGESTLFPTNGTKRRIELAKIWFDEAYQNVQRMGYKSAKSNLRIVFTEQLINHLLFSNDVVASNETCFLDISEERCRFAVVREKKEGASWTSEEEGKFQVGIPLGIKLDFKRNTNTP